jgi:hypothetical protein
MGVLSNGTCAPGAVGVSVWRAAGIGVRAFIRGVALHRMVDRFTTDKDLLA